MDNFAPVYTCHSCGADMMKNARLCPDCLKVERDKIKRKTTSRADSIKRRGLLIAGNLN